MTEGLKGDGGVRIGIDIGGTFTDLVLATEDRRLYVNKTSTTPLDPSDGVIAGLEEVLGRLRLPPCP